MTKDTNIDMPPIPAMLKRSAPDNPIIFGDWAKDLDTDLKFDLQAATNAIRFRMKRTVEDILEIGKHLCAVREMLPSDEQFGKWREAEIGMTRHTAIRMMRVHRQFGASHNATRNLTPTVLYELSKPSTPDEVVEEVVTKAQAGEKVTVVTVKDQVAQAKALLSTEAKEELAKEVLAEEKKKADERKKEREEKNRAELAAWNQDEDVASFFSGLQPGSATITDAEFEDVAPATPPEKVNPHEDAFVDFRAYVHPDDFPQAEALRWVRHLVSAHRITASEIFHDGDHLPPNPQGS